MEKHKIFVSFCSVLCLSFVLSAFLTPFLLPATASASGTVNINYTPLAPIPGTVTNDKLCEQTPTPPGCKVTNLGSYLRGIYMTGVALAGLFAVFSIVRGGFSLLFTDSILGKMEGKSIILRALGGLLVVFASFVLMDTINPALGRDLDLNLKFPQKNIVPFVGQVTPLRTPEEAYNKFLDDALKRAQGTSAKAQSIQLEREQLQLRIEHGEYKDEAEAEIINQAIGRLQTAEVVTRGYEGAVDYLSVNMRTQINACLIGQGACSVGATKANLSNMAQALVLPWTAWSSELFTPTTKPSTDKAANEAVITQMLLAAQNKVTADVVKLKASGLNEEAADLEQRMTNVKNETTFQLRCPNSKTHYIAGRGFETGNCPP